MIPLSTISQIAYACSMALALTGLAVLGLHDLLCSRLPEHQYTHVVLITVFFDLQAFCFWILSIFTFQPEQVYGR